MNRRILLLAAFGLVAALVAFWSPPASGIPVFARKYGYNCTMCHSAFPRLNDFGARYRMNGYRLPGEEQKERTVLESPPPFAARVHAGFDYVNSERDPQGQDVTRFAVTGFDLLSAGLLGQHIGYLVVYPPSLPEARGIAGQQGSLEMANVVFSSLGTRWLNVRAGRFEPAYAVFSDKRRLTFTPYLPYEASFPGGPPLSETQEGIEITGYQFSGFSYAAGWINGSSTNRLSDFPEDLYARVAYVFGRGEGQTSGQRLGLTGIFGRARPQAGAADRQRHLRLGADASLNYRQLNLELQYFLSRDQGPLWGEGSEVTTSSGSAQLNYFPMTSLAAFARFGLLLTPEEIDSDAWQAVGGARYYFVDNLALHGEYAYRSQQLQGQELRAFEHFATLRLDWAF